jgi:GntR family transcriptional regulator, rspAB operon transcriptional repressor
MGRRIDGKACILVYKRMRGLALDRDAAQGLNLHAELRRRILTGAVKPREALSETKVAAQFGVSRTPVREVFQRLAEEGLLRIVPQVGTFVAPIRLEAVYDSQFVRETLECRAVSLAAGHATGETLALLRDNLATQARFIAGRDHLAFFGADEEMHRAVMAMAGHPTAWAAIASAKLQLDRLRYLSLESLQWLQMIFAQHREIVALIAARNRKGAETAMREHLRTAFAAIERIARDNREFFEGPTLLAGKSFGNKPLGNKSRGHKSRGKWREGRP